MLMINLNMQYSEIMDQTLIGANLLLERFCDYKDRENREAEKQARRNGRRF